LADWLSRILGTSGGNREWGTRLWTGAEDWLPQNYLRLIGGLCLILFLPWLWLIFQLGDEIHGLLTGPAAEGDTRGRAYAIGVTITALAALVAAPLFLIRLHVSERQTKTAEKQAADAEQGLITDRFTKAVEQLGAEKTVKVRATRTIGFKLHTGIDDNGNPTFDEREEQQIFGEPEPVPEEVDEADITRGGWQTIEDTVPNIEVRLGAIYALERIARDSEADHIQVMELLCAYVRENAPKDSDYARKHAEKPRVDIQAILTVITRRPENRVAWEAAKDYRIDLQDTHLAGAEMDDAPLAKADLARAILKGARLERADLQGAGLMRANLQEARLEGANLQEAGLMRANLQEARLEGANLQEAGLEGATLKSADLRDADFAASSLRSADYTETQHLTQGAINAAFGVREGYGRTLLPEGLDHPAHWHVAAEAEEDSDDLRKSYGAAYDAWLEAQEPPGEGGADLP